MKTKLSQRIRANSEAAPWVIQEVISLENELEARGVFSTSAIIGAAEQAFERSAKICEEHGAAMNIHNFTIPDTGKVACNQCARAIRAEASSLQTLIPKDDADYQTWLLEQGGIGAARDGTDI